MSLTEPTLDQQPSYNQANAKLHLDRSSPKNHAVKWSKNAMPRMENSDGANQEVDVTIVGGKCIPKFYLFA